MTIEPVVASEGWGVLHLFFHLRRELLEDPGVAAKDFTERVAAFTSDDDYQVVCFSVLGTKADIGMMVLGPDLAKLDAFGIALGASPLGAGLLPAASYVSLTERSEYTATPEDEATRLVEEEGLIAGTSEHRAALDAFTERMAAYTEHRLHPRLPDKRVLGFYPMAKRRDQDANWYTLDFAERKALMAAHGKVGRTYRGRILQLITTSTGLDDWEWGVTLLADDPKAIRDVVYEMRFDTASAVYADFGPFVTGLVASPEDLARHHGLIA